MTMKRRSYGLRWVYICDGAINQWFATKAEAAESLGLGTHPLGGTEQLIHVEILAAPTKRKAKRRTK